MLVTPWGGELLTLPQTASALNGVQRTAKLTLDEGGNLRGDVHESYVGDAAAQQRWGLRAARQDVDLPFVVKPAAANGERIEELLRRFERYAEASCRRR